MALNFGSFNDGLVNAIYSIDLECDIGDQADIDVTTGERGADWEETAVTARHTYNTDSILGGFSLHIGSVDESNWLLGGGGETESLVNKRNVVVDGSRNDADADFEVAVAYKISELLSSSQGTVSTDQIELGSAAFNQSFQDILNLRMRSFGS
jgi:hypothetical protein